MLEVKYDRDADVPQGWHRTKSLTLFSALISLGRYIVFCMYCTIVATSRGTGGSSDPICSMKLT